MERKFNFTGISRHLDVIQNCYKERDCAHGERNVN